MNNRDMDEQLKAIQAPIAAPSNDLMRVIERLKEERPTERSEKSRAYAVVITQLEQAYAYLVTFAE